MAKSSVVTDRSSRAFSKGELVRFKGRGMYIVLVTNEPTEVSPRNFSGVVIHSENSYATVGTFGEDFALEAFEKFEGTIEIYN